jgi:hypothetical protein
MIDLLHHFVDIDVERRESRRRQGVDEGDPADARELRGPFVGDAALGIPDHRRGQAHLLHDFLGRALQRRKSVVGQFDRYRGHVSASPISIFAARTDESSGRLI